MTTPKRYLVLTLFLLLVFLGNPLVHAADQKNPQITFMTPQVKGAEHYKSEPLLLIVNVLNSAATNEAAVNKRNKAILAGMRKSEVYKTLNKDQKDELTKKYKTLKVPKLQFGSRNKPWSDAIRIVVTDKDKKEIAVTVRPLANTQDKQGNVALDAEHTALMNFGIDPEELAKLPNGVYTLQAFAGESASVPLVVKLRDGFSRLNSTDQTRVYEISGAYSLFDKQYTKARTYAEKILENNPQSVAGWSHLGDALDGEGKPKEALEAFRKGIDAHYATVKETTDRPVEAPVYIYSRIRQIQAKL